MTRRGYRRAIRQMVSAVSANADTSTDLLSWGTGAHSQERGSTSWRLARTARFRGRGVGAARGAAAPPAIGDSPARAQVRLADESTIAGHRLCAA